LTKLSNIEDFENFLSSAEESFAKMNELSKNAELSPEEKEKLSKEYMAKIQEITDVYKTILGSVRQRGKGEKVSKYSLFESIRKHKNFAYSFLNIEEDSDIENVTDCMYNLMNEVLNESDLNKKYRLGQLYSIALRKNFNSFKENMIEMIENEASEETKYDIGSDFYAAYFKMIVEAVSKKYNDEVEERIKAEKKLAAARRAKAEKMETPNEIVGEGETSKEVEANT